MESCLLLFSGGLDSSILLASLLKNGYKVLPLIVSYTQKHIIETIRAKQILSYLNVGKFITLDFSDWGRNLKSSLTTYNIDILKKPYSKKVINNSIVPHRNMTFLSAGAGIAVSNKCSIIAMAAHSGDHEIYPDCRREFFDQFQYLLQLSYPGYNLRVYTPFVYLTKGQIISTFGKQLDNQEKLYSMTWSCYEGGIYHCGKCATCIERKQAFFEADILDPTIYEGV